MPSIGGFVFDDGRIDELHLAAPERLARDREDDPPAAAAYERPDEARLEALRCRGALPGRPPGAVPGPEYSGRLDVSDETSRTDAAAVKRTQTGFEAEAEAQVSLRAYGR